LQALLHIVTQDSELNIHIAKRSIVAPKLIMGVQQLDWSSKPGQIDGCLCGIGLTSLLPAAPRPHPVSAVIHGVPVHGDSIEAVVGVLHLPDPPEPVDGAMVEIEDGVARRGAGIAARVDSVDVVAGGVNLFCQATQVSCHCLFVTKT